MRSNECNKCSKNYAFYFRPYSGELLCKKCFIRSVEYKAKKTLSRFSMIKDGEKVAIAVSGGKDSLTLLHLLKKLLHDARNELVAITVDEGIKGYRDESLQIVKKFCSKIGVESNIVSYKELFDLSMDEAMTKRPSKKVSSCSICGTFRRRAIDLLAESCRANVIATGHNLDDYIQTFFINLFAGDIERIGWTYPKSVEYGYGGLRKIKPLTEIYEKELALYAIQLNIPFQSEECPYMDESIRSNFRNHLNDLEKVHPGIKYNAYNSILKISKRLSSTSTIINQKRGQCLICKRDSSNNICSACRMMNLLIKQN